MKKFILLFIFLPLCCFAQTRPDYLDIRNIPLVNVKSFGVDKTGTVNGAASFTAAISAARSKGLGVYIPGDVKLLIGNNTITVDVPIVAATGSLIIGTSQTDNGSLLLKTGARLCDLRLQYVRVEGSYADDVLIERCNIKDVEAFGIRMSYSNAVSTGGPVIIRENVIENIDYVAAGTGGADGIVVMTSQNVRIFNNQVSDFERIGIVADRFSTDTLWTSNIQIEGNTVFNAHDCDDSTTEFNAGIWLENTGYATVKKNVCYDISGNAGQTSGRVRGVVCVGAQAGTTPCGTWDVSNNYIDGVLQLGDTNPNTIMLVENNIIDQAANGELSAVAITGTYFKRIALRNNNFRDFTIGAISTPLILLGSNTIATQTQGIVEIDGCVFGSTIASATASDIMVYYNLPPEQLIIRNCGDITIGGITSSVAAGTRLTVENTTITPNPIYPVRMFDFVEYKNTSINGGVVGGGALLNINNATILDTISLLCSSSLSYINLTNSVIASGGILLPTQTPAYYLFRGNAFYGADGGTGAVIYGPYTANQPNSVLSIQSCIFKKPTHGTVAIPDTSFDFGKCIVTDNQYDWGAFITIVGTATPNTDF